MSDLLLVLPIALVATGLGIVGVMAVLGTISPVGSAVAMLLCVLGLATSFGSPWNIAIIIAGAAAVLTFMVLKVVEYRRLQRDGH